MDSLLASSTVPGTKQEASQATNHHKIKKNFKENFHIFSEDF